MVSGKRVCKAEAYACSLWCGYVSFCSFWCGCFFFALFGVYSFALSGVGVFSYGRAFFFCGCSTDALEAQEGMRRA